MNKQFFYKSEDYLHRTYTETYTREGRWKKINYTLSGNPYFTHNGKRYRLDDFLRAGAAGFTTEIKSKDGEAVALAGYEGETYYKPLFIEIDEGGEACRVYRYEGSTTE